MQKVLSTKLESEEINRFEEIAQQEGESDLPPSNEASYNIVKRGTKNAKENQHTGTDHQQTQGS